MSIMNSNNVVNIVRGTLNQVDNRLVEHGARVAYLVLKMLQYKGSCKGKALRDICFLSMLHDIGAYKTEEIDQMVQFETSNVWEHSTYGYLFIKHLSPLDHLAHIVLYHHLHFAKLGKVDCGNKDIIQLLNLADRVDMYLQTQGSIPDISPWANTKFSMESIALFQAAEREGQITKALDGGKYITELLDVLGAESFSQNEIDSYLRMVVYAIDFRSEHTVMHTITTVSIGVEIAKACQLSDGEVNKIRYGALLHDLGKIAIPVEILESPFKLSEKDMAIMKTHVELSEKIIRGNVDDEICKIAVRHHEKINGTGYPRGLEGCSLNRNERILAVADVISALSGTRSYKQAFDDGKIIEILRSMSEGGALCPDIVKVTLENYDQIMQNAGKDCKPVLETYSKISSEFAELSLRIQGI